MLDKIRKGQSLIYDFSIFYETWKRNADSYQIASDPYKFGNIEIASKCLT